MTCKFDVGERNSSLVEDNLYEIRILYHLRVRAGEWCSFASTRVVHSVSSINSRKKGKEKILGPRKYLTGKTFTRRYG